MAVPPCTPPDGCLLYVGTLYDLFQLLSLLSIVGMVLFVRSQFNRVEQVGVSGGVVVGGVGSAPPSPHCRSAAMPWCLKWSDCCR